MGHYCNMRLLQPLSSSEACMRPVRVNSKRFYERSWEITHWPKPFTVYVLSRWQLAGARYYLHVYVGLVDSEAISLLESAG